MYTIRCWNFNKRINSTATPSGSGTAEFQAELKRGCSVMAPVFLLNSDSFDYNYIRFNGRYYWVDNISWERNNLVSVTCRVDVLGSWKDEINNTTAFVNYSQTAFNSYLRDERIPKSTYGVSRSATTTLPNFNTDGCYLLGSIGNTNSRTAGGMININAMTQNALNDLSVFFSTEEDIVTQITSQFGNAFGCICFLRWIPYTLNTSGTTISLGKSNTGIPAGAVTQRTIHGTVYVEMPWFGNDFRNFEPYSQGYLSLPFVGVVQLSLSQLSEVITMAIAYTADLFTGDITYSIVNAYGKMAVYTGNFASDIPVANYQRNIKGATVSAISTIDSLGGIGARAVAGMMSGKQAVDAMVQGFASGSLDYMTLQTGVQGGFGGVCGAYLGMDVTVIIATQDTAQSPSSMAAVAGRPCGKTLKMGNISGYTECSGFKVSGTMTAQEKEMIEAYMRGGVYLE